MSWRSRSLLALLLVTSPLVACAQGAAWTAKLKDRLAALDRETPGELGVWVKSLADGEQVGHQAERAYYLSSTIKVPVAIVLLQEVERGEVSLERELTLKASDPVDGAGPIQAMKPGAKLKVGYLLEQMLVHSDSTAADMLIRLVGEEDLNAFLRGHGLGPVTTIMQVRYDAYRELHPEAERLSSQDIYAIQQSGGWAQRRQAFARKLGVSPDELKAPSLGEAFERYYRRGLNSASLVAYGQLLEKLVNGQLLSPEHTELLLGHMQAITTGSRRIQAGLPGGTRFAQKTGTQIGRMCNMGVVNPRSPRAVVIAACLEKYPSQREAEAVLRRVGEALAQSGALGSG